MKSWLLNFVSKDIRASVIYNNVASDIWNELKEHFSHTNSIYLFYIEQEIHGSVQGNMNIGAYYTKLKRFWDEGNALCFLPTCACGAAKELMQFQQSQKTMKFLMGLNEPYAAVRGQILLMVPFLLSTRLSYSLFKMRSREQSQHMLLEDTQSQMHHLSSCGTTCETLVGIFLLKILISNVIVVMQPDIL